VTCEAHAATCAVTLDRGLDTWRSSGYTLGMKTAISVPDEVFERAEHLAKHLKMSRSELYSRAVAEFLSRYSPDQVTESFDRVCAAIGGEPDPAIQRAARRVLERSEW
jgi:hypothetical protein